MPASSEEPCANPLLLQWVKEMYDLAKERNTKGVTIYAKAYKSMRACPLTLQHPSEAIQLNGIGEKICKRLTEKLEEHCKANGLPMPKKPRGEKRLSGEDLNPGEERPPPKKLRKPKPYVPGRRTGPYAIVLALSSLPKDSLQSLTKAELIELAQPHCDSDFLIPSETGKFYTAWNSVTKLIDKDLVHERGRPLRRYALTEDGWDTARRIRAVEDGQLRQLPSPSEKRRSRSDSRPQDSPMRSRDARKSIARAEASKDDSIVQGTLRPVPGHRIALPTTDRDVAPAPHDQRLGGAPTDRYGTSPKAQEDCTTNTGPQPDVVELLSSPEPVERSSSTGMAQKETNVLEMPIEKFPSRGKVKNGDARPFQLSALASVQVKAKGLPAFTPIVIRPGSFTIQLVLDNREVRAKGETTPHISKQLSSLGVQHVVRPLPLGDVFWVAKLHDEHLLPSNYGEGDEIALDWIVERKRLDDLIGSITDGRFNEQKFRLSRAGVKNVIYLIEHFTLQNDTAEKFNEAVQSAIASTQVVNGYFVKRTTQLEESIRYLANLTTIIKSLYESKSLYIIPSTVLSPTSYIPLINHLRTDPAHRHKAYNITMHSFESLASKTDTLTLRDVYLKMLMCTRGISGDKAIAIQKHWPTPRMLVEAFEQCEDEKHKDKLVESKLGGLVGRAMVKEVLSAKVAGIWAKA